VTLPDNLIEEIDSLVGQGDRSQFIASAVELELRRRQMSVALEEMGGALADVDIPGWETRESAAAWVRAMRRGEPLPGSSIAIDDCTS
jgi:Arc/MetJ-type ribon-helix-helix transcriptional regulator